MRRAIQALCAAAIVAFLVSHPAFAAGVGKIRAIAQSELERLGITSSAVVAQSSGTAGAPSYTWAGDTDTGMFRIASGRIGFSSNGVQTYEFTGTALRARDDACLQFGTSADMVRQGELTALADNGSPDTVFSIISANGDMPGVEIVYTIQSTDGTDAATEQGTVRVAMVDLAGVVEATLAETSVQELSAGITTLTTTWSVDTTDDGVIEIRVNADVSDITPTTHQVRWIATHSGDVVIQTVP